MKLILTSSFALVALVSTSVCKAQVSTGATSWHSAGEIKSFCMKAGSAIEAGMCLGYLEGVAETLDQRTICIPDKVSAQELKDVFFKHIEDRPSSEHLQAASVIAVAFEDAYPCKAGKSP